MQNTKFSHALGANKSVVTDYRTVALSIIRPNLQYLNGVNNFQNDYSMISVIDQLQEPECVEAVQKVYMQKKLLKTTGILPDISTRALYQLARMYADDPTGAPGSQPHYANMVALHSGMISSTLVPEDRTLDPAIYGGDLDVNLEMTADAVKKMISGLAVPNLTLPELTNAIQLDDGVMVTILIDDSWFEYQPGVKELDGTGTFIGTHRVLLTGFQVKQDGYLWFYGRNSWGKEWGMNGDFEFNSSIYMPHMSEPAVYTTVPNQILDVIHNSPVKPSHTFTKALRMGMTDPDIIALQNILKYEGLYPLGVASNGTYGARTISAVLAFQERYAIADFDTLDVENRGQSFGPVTMAKANELYSSPIKGKITVWALAAQAHEGYFPPGQNAATPRGSLSWRNKNPGNFKWDGQPNAVQSGVWACFDTYQHGFDYLCNFLQTCATTGHGPYLPTMTLLQFYEKYSPDGTAPAYAAFVAQRCGVKVDAPIFALLN